LKDMVAASPEPPMPNRPAAVPIAAIDAVRDFNRAYTRITGLLDQHLVDSPFTLTEARVLYELAQREAATASEIGAGLGLDAGYLSRILQKFADGDLLTRSSGADRRQQQIRLTARGRSTFKGLERAAREAVGALLQPLAPARREALLAAMTTITTLLQAGAAAPALRLRAPEPGDMGWVVERHGAVYARSYGWGPRFEALVAEIVAAFLKDNDPAREACWIAELDGRRAGSVFIVRHSDEVAQLRLLLVEPEARGHGVGRALVEACIGFARARGYRRITLWTQSMLTEARALYAGLGFVRTASEPHSHFGVALTGETWELAL
jgi:DNA-binding MarR family transcriptional regulator/GNAT superfamily N-acetyltransferase